jgi:hypothetical protein
MKIDEVLAELQVSNAPVPVDGSIMAKAREAMLKQRTERVLNVVTQELELAEKCKAAQLQTVRRLRSQLETQLKGLKDLTRASDYAEQTGNFLPLAFAMGGMSAVTRICNNLNVEHVEAKNPLLKVPEDWNKSKS